jgi:hypothetical protein
MPRTDCEDCHGSGEIECESIVFGRMYFDKEVGHVVTPMTGLGDWHMAQCPCVGEEDD